MKQIHKEQSVANNSVHLQVILNEISSQIFLKLLSQDPINVIARSHREDCKYFPIIILLIYRLGILGEILKHEILQ